MIGNNIDNGTNDNDTNENDTNDNKDNNNNNNNNNNNVSDEQNFVTDLVLQWNPVQFFQHGV